MLKLEKNEFFVTEPLHCEKCTFLKNPELRDFFSNKVSGYKLEAYPFRCSEQSSQVLRMKKAEMLRKEVLTE